LVVAEEILRAAGAPLHEVRAVVEAEVVLADVAEHAAPPEVRGRLVRLGNGERARGAVEPGGAAGAGSQADGDAGARSERGDEGVGAGLRRREVRAPSVPASRRGVARIAVGREIAGDDV